MKKRLGKGLGRNYSFLLSTVALNGIGDGLTIIAIPWIATGITDNALYISLISVFMFLPWLLFTIPTGVILDRYSNIYVMLFTSVFRFMTLLIFCLLIYFDNLSFPSLVILCFFIGTAKVLFDSSTQTIVPNLVDNANYEKANGNLFSTRMITSDLLGQGIGGLIITIALFLPILIDAFTALLSIPLLLMISYSKLPSSTYKLPDSKYKSKWRVLKEEQTFGIKFVWRNKFLRGLSLISIGISMMYAGILSTQVLYVQNVLNLNAGGFGLLMVLTSIGSIVAGQTASKIKLAANNGMLLSIICMGLALGFVGFTNNIYVVTILYIFAAYSVVIWNVFRLSLIQRIVDQEILGRVTSVFRLVSMGVTPFGMLFGGLIVSILENPFGLEIALRLPYILCMIVYITSFFVAYKFFKSHKNILYKS
ncbi:MFS transporter [Shouchella patagoniensis]|uniref:MFS transporter n=1 Tax=Shouchella patagoniensis TaxID=228576 RepID=UPI000994E07D|nr:MFS transporter [Shouchella patagoniensis]